MTEHLIGVLEDMMSSNRHKRLGLHVIANADLQTVCVCTCTVGNFCDESDGYMLHESTP